MHALPLTLTLIDMGGRGMGEWAHGQERVGRPSLASPRPMLSEYHRRYSIIMLRTASMLDENSYGVTCPTGARVWSAFRYRSIVGPALHQD
jgi:hypothetical protein